MSKKSNKKNRFLIFVIPIVFLSTLLVFFLLTLFTETYQNKQKLKLKCDTGFMTKSAFLDVYEVKSGDTLLSIAQNEVGNVNRVDELINVNKDLHRLSVSNGFLEVGYKLYLPPREIFTSSGKLIGFKGEIETIVGNQWGMKSSPGGTNYFYLNENSVFKGDQEDFKEGDCIKLIIDEDDRRILVADHQ